MEARIAKFPIEVFWSDEDEGYIAVVPDLPGCNAGGKTEAEAIRGRRTMPSRRRSRAPRA